MAKDKPKGVFLVSGAGRDYLIRDFPRDLKLRAQHRALNEGLSLKGLILQALEEYLAK